MTDGYVIAVENYVSPRGEIGAQFVWDLISGNASKPSASEMSQARQARRGKKVRQFTDAAWDDLPAGMKATDWVWLGDGHVLRDDS